MAAIIIGPANNSPGKCTFRWYLNDVSLTGKENRMKNTLKYMLLGLMVWLGMLVPAAAQDKGTASAQQATLTFGLNTRFRYEFQDGFNQKYYGPNPPRGQSSDGFLLGRFRAGLDWYPTQKIHIALWGQHSTCWGNALPDSAFYKGTLGTEHNPNKDYWELYTTFIEFKNLMDTGIGLKAGRQILAYGDNRVFGPGQWGNSGRYIWDAVKVSWKHQRGFVDIFYGQNMMHEVHRFSLKHRHQFETLGMYAHYDIMKKPYALFVEPMLFTKRDSHDNYSGEDKTLGDVSTWYGGLRLAVNKLRGFDFDATYLREEGSFSSDDQRAYGYHLLLAYTFPVRFTPRVSVEYSYASGDNNPKDGTRRTFHSAFGARDKMYGRMNLFHWMNLQDLQVNVEVKPKPWLYVKMEVHKFKLAERKDAWYLNQKTYRDPSGASGDNVGKELDIIATIKLPHGNKLMAGFGHFRPDEFAEKQASSRHANWCFVQWEYTFQHALIK